MTDSWSDAKDFVFLVKMQEAGFLIVEFQFVISHFHFCSFRCLIMYVLSSVLDKVLDEMKVLAYM